MSFFRTFVGVLGGLLISLGLSLLIGVLFLSQFAAQEAKMDSLFDETFTLLVEQDPEHISSALREDAQFEEYFLACDAGTVPEEECAVSVENPALVSYFDTVKEELQTQISPAFRSLDTYMEKRVLFAALGLVCFFLGCFFLYFGLDSHKYLFSRKLSGKLGFYFLFSFFLVFFLLHLQKQDLLSLFQWIIAGAPEVLYLFASTFLLLLLRSLFQVFFYPFLILSIVFLALWIGLWIYPWIQAKRKKKLD